MPHFQDPDLLFCAAAVCVPIDKLDNTEQSFCFGLSYGNMRFSQGKNKFVVESLLIGQIQDECCCQSGHNLAFVNCYRAPALALALALVPTLAPPKV